MEKKFKQAFDKIKKANNILLVTHTRPDGDGLASVCAIAELLEQINKPYSAYCYDTPPFQYDFLPHLEKITSDKDALNFSQFDLIIVLDCGDLSRTKLDNEILNRNSNQFIIEFDHHPKVDDYANIEIRDPNTSSTSELIYDFLKVNKVKINKNIASCILTGIASDTNFFFFPNTSNKTIDIASAMLKYGVRLPQIVEHTWRNKSLGAMKIWGKAISNLIINKKYNLACSILSEEDLDGSEISREELEGISEFLSNIENVKGVLLIREENGQIRGNLRSNHVDIDISILAKKLGGGGHAKASGFTIDGKLEKTGGSWRIV